MLNLFKFLTRKKIFFLISRSFRTLLVFIGFYLIQIFLIQNYPPSVNSSIQISLKLVGIQGLFTTGFSILILSCPDEFKDFILKNNQAYWLSLVSRILLLGFVSIFLLFFCSSFVNSKINLLFYPIIFFLLLGILSGEGQAVAYASNKSLGYEVRVLAAQCFSFALLFGCLFLNISSSILQILVFIVFVAPKYLIDFYYAFEKIPPLPKTIWPKKSTINLMLKSFSCSLLSVTAFLNWSTDVILLGSMGSPREVNSLALLSLIFSIPTVFLGFLTPNIQLRWSKNLAKNRVKIDMMLLIVFSFMSIICIAFAYIIGSLCLENFFPINPLSCLGLFLSVAISSFLACLSNIIGVLMNSNLMIGRQVLIIGLVVTPINLSLSFVLFPFIGAIGIVMSTIVSQLITIFANVVILRSSNFSNSLNAQ